MLTALVIAVLILSFVTVPFALGISVDADISDGKGKMKISVFGIPVFKASLELEKSGALKNNIVITSGKKREEIHLNADKNDEKSIMSVFHAMPIMSYIMLDSIKVGIEVGVASDAFVTTLAAGALRTVLYSFTAFVKSRHDARISETVKAEYNRNVLDLEFFGIFKLSVANIINSFIAGLLNKLKIMAKHNGKKRVKYARIVGAR